MRCIFMGTVMICLIFLGGCSASMITSSDSLGGVQAGPRWGIVKYLNQGDDGVIKSRQDSARKLMERFCNPLNYRVVQIGQQSDFFAYLGGSGAGFGGAAGTFNYLYIKFECVDSPKLDENDATKKSI